MVMRIIMMMMMVCHHLLYIECHKRIRNFALAQNDSKLLVDVVKWQEKLENPKLARLNKAKHYY